ncbi:hypothetical protein BDDG_12056 [Blastomyces dermatitidis ATCC 18188]|uniref:Uncharacterized protein n=1 Tax=Ajellomyces dermatitidis (strain ATCC 18188 / CBS 674.68) TaxID=653446 RepID=A0A0J9EQ52_AJEDA|nr:hypothetical protein BDDG_12056 [Blastomyces dermatitidis ATCC 18188]
MEPESQEDKKIWRYLTEYFRRIMDFPDTSPYVPERFWKKRIDNRKKLKETSSTGDRSIR